MHSLRFRSWLNCSGLVALPWLLCVPAGACAGAAVYRRVDAHGRVAFQANACPAQMRQTAVEIREQPLIDPGAPAAMTSPIRMKHEADAPHRANAHPRARGTSRRASARKEEGSLSWECRASDGEVFYRHTRCPHSVPGDGVMRSTGTYVMGRGHGKRRGGHNAWSPVPVHARKVSRSEACRQINAVAAVDRDGHARDERVSVYEHDVGRDPCSGY